MRSRVELARFGVVRASSSPATATSSGPWGRPGDARPLPVDSDLDYFLALEPALTLGFDETGRERAGDGSGVSGGG